MSAAKYPWASWLNGDSHVIYRAVDYEISSHNMQISLHSKARHKGLRVTSRTFTEHLRDDSGTLATREGLWFQFLPRET